MGMIVEIPTYWTPPGIDTEIYEHPLPLGGVDGKLKKHQEFAFMHF